MYSYSAWPLQSTGILGFFAADCVQCYEDAIAAQVEEQRQLDELRDEMNRAGVNLVPRIACTTTVVIELSLELVVRQSVGGTT